MKKLIVTILLACACFSVQIFADDDVEQDEAYRMRKQGAILPLEKILEVAQKYHPGRIIEVELQKEHSRYIYEVELADNDGRVWEMKIDAKTAVLLESERED